LINAVFVYRRDKNNPDFIMKKDLNFLTLYTLDKIPHNKAKKSFDGKMRREYNMVEIETR
jgi:hypothetical protein